MVLVLGGLWIGQNVKLLPVDASLNAPVYDELFRVLFSIGAVLFIGVVGLLLFSLVRFRRHLDEPRDGVVMEGNFPLEIFWTAVPAIVVFFVSLYSYDIYDRMGGMIPLSQQSHHNTSVAAADERIWGGISSGPVEAISPARVSLPVEVTAMQFAFIFHYPGVEITSGELHIPAGRQVDLRLEARDVIHAFWVPEFRLKQDIIPGQPTLLSFTPTVPGRYPIICAELCGPYHGSMRSTVVVEEPKVFDEWLRRNSNLPVEA